MEKENEIKVVKVDCKNQQVFNKEIVYEHAVKLLKLQLKMGRNDWTLSKDQNLIFKNGDIIKSGKN